MSVKLDTLYCRCNAVVAFRSPVCNADEAVAASLELLQRTCRIRGLVMERIVVDEADLCSVSLVSVRQHHVVAHIIPSVLARADASVGV